MLASKNIQTLLQLVQENPECEIVPMVDAEVIFNDDYRWWAGSWGSAGLDEIYTTEEAVYFKSQSYEDLIDTKADELADSYPELSDAALFGKAEVIVGEYAWKKVIVVWIESFI